MAEAQVHFPRSFLVQGPLGLKAGDCPKGHSRLGFPQALPIRNGADLFKQALSMQKSELILVMSGSHRSVGNRDVESPLCLAGAGSETARHLGWKGEAEKPRH